MAIYDRNNAFAALPQLEKRVAELEEIIKDLKERIEDLENASN